MHEEPPPVPPHPLADHNPWALTPNALDSADGNVEEWDQPDGTHVRRTMRVNYGDGAPNQQELASGQDIIQSMLGGLMGSIMGGGRPPGADQQQPLPSVPRHTNPGNLASINPQFRPQPNPFSALGRPVPTAATHQPGIPGMGATTRTSQFSFGPFNIVAHSTVRSSGTINGRPIEGGPMGDDDLMGIFRGTLGPMMATQGGGPPMPAGGAFVMGGFPGEGQQQGMGGLGGIGALLQHFLNPANAQAGDAVFTQEAMDRLMTRFMQENQTSTAPGPASQSAIHSLPRITIGKEQEDSTTGKAECSICMDAVEAGTEVAELPCKHWFHFECISAWLGEHDTCPQCRRGIMPRDDADGAGGQAAGSATPASPGQGAAAGGSAERRSSTGRIRRTGEPPRHWQASSPSLSRSTTLDEASPAGQQAQSRSAPQSQPQPQIPGQFPDVDALRTLRQQHHHQAGAAGPPPVPSPSSPPGGGGGGSLRSPDASGSSRWRSSSRSREGSSADAGSNASAVSAMSGIASGIAGWMGRHFGGAHGPEPGSAAAPASPNVTYRVSTNSSTGAWTPSGHTTRSGADGAGRTANAGERDTQGRMPGQGREPSHEDFDVD